jgi:hypothetical protein
MIGHDQAQTAMAREIREIPLQLSPFWQNMIWSQLLQIASATQPASS